MNTSTKLKVNLLIDYVFLIQAQVVPIYSTGNIQKPKGNGKYARAHGQLSKSLIVKVAQQKNQGFI